MTSSALVFVCTSMDSSIIASSEDCSQEEAIATLEQVSAIILYKVSQTTCMVPSRSSVTLQLIHGHL